jgi:hypothetical protein
MLIWCIKIGILWILHLTLDLAQFHGTVLVFFGSCTIFTIFVSDFQLFRPEYHWRDLSSRNAHLVHQNWYRISFAFYKLVDILIWCIKISTI